MDRIIGYEPIDSGSNPDRGIILLTIVFNISLRHKIKNYIRAGVPSGEGGGL